jgi:hypothetical protein
MQVGCQDKLERVAQVAVQTETVFCTVLKQAPAILHRFSDAPSGYLKTRAKIAST